MMRSATITTTADLAQSRAATDLGLSDVLAEVAEIEAGSAGDLIDSAVGAALVRGTESRVRKPAS